MNGVEFNAERHEYKAGGLIIPGVTTVLQSAGLIDDRFFTEEGRTRGTAVHQACHYFDEDDLDKGSVLDEYLPYVEAHERFVADTGIEWAMIEGIVRNEQYNYIGTLDRTGVLNDRRVLIDLKTGNPGVSAGPQTAAYEACLVNRHCRYSLQLKDDGTYKLRRCAGRNDFKIFLAALAIHNWKNRGGK